MSCIRCCTTNFHSIALPGNMLQIDFACFTLHPHGYPLLPLRRHGANRKRRVSALRIVIALIIALAVVLLLASDAQ